MAKTKKIDKKPVKKKVCGIKKKLPKSSLHYTQENLEAALNAMGNGETLRQIASRYGIPKSTLFNKAKNYSQIKCRKGPPTVLKDSEEQEIVLWIKYCASRGFPVRKKMLLDCVQKFVVAAKREVPFKNNRPGRYWYKAFMKRHPDLSEKMAQNLTSTRASMQEKDVRDWFKKVEIIRNKGLSDISSDRIYNCDESAFRLCPESNKCIAGKGASTVYNVVGGGDKECLSVLIIANAAGTMAPPMILFEGKKLPEKAVLSKIPNGWGVGLTESGWMTADSFYCYVTNVFLKYLKNNNGEFPVVLYLDGHSSHNTLPLCKFCKENNIELVPLFPNSTHFLQPLDVSLFHPLKDKYSEILVEWRIRNNVVNFKREMFAEVLDMALKQIDFNRIVKNGFKTCGLHPFDPNIVNYNVLRKKKGTCKKVTNDDITVENEEAAKQTNEKFLEFFEKHMVSPELLKDFKLIDESLDEQEINKNALFQVWSKLRRICGSSKPGEGVTDTEVIDIETSMSIGESPIENVDVLTGCEESTDSLLYEDVPIIIIQQADFNVQSHLDTFSSSVLQVPEVDLTLLHICNDEQLIPNTNSEVIMDHTEIDISETNNNNRIIEEPITENPNSNKRLFDKNNDTHSEVAAIISEKSIENNNLNIQPANIHDDNANMFPLDLSNSHASSTDLDNSQNTNEHIAPPTTTVLSEIQNKSAVDNESISKSNSTSPFKEIFFYPNVDITNKKKERIPSGATVDEMIHYLSVKEQKKEQQQRDLMQRKQDRERKKLLKKKKVCEAKSIRRKKRIYWKEKEILIKN